MLVGLYRFGHGHVELRSELVKEGKVWLSKRVRLLVGSSVVGDVSGIAYLGSGSMVGAMLGASASGREIAHAGRGRIWSIKRRAWNIRNGIYTLADYV